VLPLVGADLANNIGLSQGERAGSKRSIDHRLGPEGLSQCRDLWSGRHRRCGDSINVGANRVARRVLVGLFQ
jgi:hypothetical protein